MDFHCLSRRDLQSLCKKNRIPANMTNVAMADALQALQAVEGIDEIKEVSQFQSPTKAEGRSLDLPHTTRRSSTRRAPIQDEGREQGSPLPRSRRVTVKASEFMKMVAEGEDEKAENPQDMPKTPAVPTGRKPRATPNTRRKASKKEDEGKEEEEKQGGHEEITATPAPGNGRSTRKRRGKNEEKGHEGPTEMATPATRCGQRTSTRRAAAAPVAGEEKDEKAAGARTTRRTRQSSKKQMEEVAADATADVGRRTTRSKAAIKVAALDQEKEKKEEGFTGEVEETRESMDPKEEADVEPMDLMGAISDLCDRFAEAKMEGSDGAQGPTFDGEDSKQDGKSDAESIDSSLHQPIGEINVEEENPNVESFSELQKEERRVEGAQQEEQGSDKFDDLSGLQESPVRGLVSSDQHTEQGDQDEDLDQIEIIIGEHRSPMEELISQDEAPKENPMGVDGGLYPDGEEDWIRATGDHISPATEDLLLPKEEEKTNLDQNSGEPQTMNQLPNADPQIADGVAGFYCEIRACDCDVSGELLPESDNSVEYGDIVEEEESSDKLPIGGLPALESGSILDSTTSSPLQKIPLRYPTMESSDAAVSPARASAEFGDLIGELVEEEAEESSGKLPIGAPGSGSILESTTSSPLQKIPLRDAAESPARAAAEFGDLIGELVEEEAKESSGKLPISGQPAPGCGSILESTTSSPLQKIPLPYPIVESSDAAVSPARASAEFGDLIGEVVEEEAKESSGKLPIGGQPAPGCGSILESTTSSPLQKIPSPYPIVESSDAAVSPAKASAEFGDLIGERPDSDATSLAKTSSQLSDLIGDDSIVRSPWKSSARIGDPIKESEENEDPAKAICDSLASLDIGTLPDSGLVIGAPAALPSVSVDDEPKGFVPEAAGSENNSEGSAGIYRSKESGEDEENAGATGLTASTDVGAGCGEAKAKQKAVDLKLLSLNKLKAMYKEKASMINTEVEGKRSALSAVDENQPSLMGGGLQRTE